MSPLAYSIKDHYHVTDCYPHCSVFTVHNCTKTSVGCGVSYNKCALSGVVLMAFDSDWNDSLQSKV